MNILSAAKAFNKLLLLIIFSTWGILVYSYFFDLNIKGKGALAGDAAIIFLWVSSLPGILKRFRVRGLLAKLQVFLMTCRRRLGILMFMFAVMHFAWYGLYRNLQKGLLPNFYDMSLHAKLGFIAVALAIPLYLTSNDVSVKLLGTLWQKIHNMVYLIMWFSAAHVFFNDNIEWAIPTGVVGILQIASHIYKKSYTK